MEPDPAVDELVAAAIEFLDAPPVERHRLAASLPEVASNHRIDVAAIDRGIVVVVRPRCDEWTSLLTPRERDTASAVARGLTNREIARELFVSEATVKDHVHHILAKTGLPNRAAIAGRWRAGVHR